MSEVRASGASSSRNSGYSPSGWFARSVGQDDERDQPILVTDLINLYMNVVPIEVIPYLLNITFSHVMNKLEIK